MKDPVTPEAKESFGKMSNVKDSDFSDSRRRANVRNTDLGVAEN